MGRKLGFPRVVIAEEVTKGYEDKYPWKSGDRVLLIGEIANMGEDHVAVATKDGKVHWGYHEVHFREATEDDL